jgi:hypothetical protein
MEKRCSLSHLGNILCGQSRGVSAIVSLLDCKEDIQHHLASCHLSKSNLNEYELILARAGLFRLHNEQIKSMVVCARHRHTLGRYWRPLRTCQYPGHTGKKRSFKGRNVFNVPLSEEVHNLFGSLVQVGSRKY